MDKEVLEVVLKEVNKGFNMQRIIDVENESALPKGENYTSMVLRLKLKLVLGNGRIAKRTLIMKKGNSGDAADQIEKDLDLFRNEALMYSVVFKEMEYLMEESEDYEEPLWCKFIHYNRLSRAIVLEDLQASGFRLVKRQIGLDLQHALLVLRSLGRYHAMAKTLEERGIISKDGYKPYPLLKDSEYTRYIFYAGLKSFGKAIKKYWGPEWENVADKLMMPEEKFVKNILASTKLMEGDFTCLNHGDCWSNNMMFKHDWQGRPISLRFLDFQGPHYHSPCVDVSYFMHISIQPEVRRLNYENLLQCYHGSLAYYLKKFGYKGTIPTFKHITEVMERFSFFGFSVITSWYPIVTCESKDAFNLENLLKTKGEEGYNEEIYKEPGLILRIGADLKDLVQKHSIEISHL